MPPYRRLSQHDATHRRSRSSAIALCFSPDAHQCLTLSLNVTGISFAAGREGIAAAAVDREVSTTVIVGPMRANRGRARRSGLSVVADDLHDVVDKWW
jgi:hypothetical protein